MADLTFTYRVFSADEVRASSEAVVDGETVTIVRDVVAVQLVPESPGHTNTITLNVPRGQAEDHPFNVGALITVTFAGGGE